MNDKLMNGVHWSTKDEMNFIKSLRKRNPAAFQKYADAVEHRQNWGRVNKWEVIDYIVEHTPEAN